MQLAINNFTRNTSLLEIKRATTPQEYADFLRSNGKIFYWDAARFFVVTDFELAKETLKSPAFSADRTSFFISRMPNIDLAIIKDFFSIVQKMMVMSDGKEHELRRKAAALGIDGELLEYYRPIIMATIKNILTKAKKKNSINFSTEIAEPLPSMVLADLFCIDENDRENFYRASLTMTQFFGGAVEYNNEAGKNVNAAAIHIRNYFMELIEKRKISPKNDFFTILLKNKDRLQLSDEEILAQAVMMLVAGQVTTTDQINNNLFTLLETKSISKLQQNMAILPLAIEEFNRLDPGVSYIFRTVKKPIQLGGLRLEPEDVVFISTHSVNRDPAIFANPNQCILDRGINPHFAYGHGSHFCLGSRLARMQMQLLFAEMIETFPEMQIDPSEKVIRNHYALAFSGFSKIPLILEPNRYDQI